MKKYVIHPGTVISKNDGQNHFITYRDLIYLYKLNPEECIDSRTQNPMTWESSEITLQHLFPKENGNYTTTEMLDSTFLKIRSKLP